jgi:HSP20 family protein
LGRTTIITKEAFTIDKDNIEVNLTDDTLTIKGKKKKEEEIKEENYYRPERTYGSFVGNVELPKAGTPIK